LTLDHVQVIAPRGGVDEARRFYGELIGLEEIARPPSMGGAGAWFRAGPHELHVSEHEPFAPATKAHPAFSLDDAALDELAARLGEAGVEVTWDERLPGARRFYASDPAGNRLEFLARA
jgi:catechol 2,3-dioxygenase-like lactoylglutathione lyase family enzyme